MAFPLKSTIDDVITDHYGWWVTENAHKFLYRSFGSVAAVSLAFGILSI